MVVPDSFGRRNILIALGCGKPNCQTFCGPCKVGRVKLLKNNSGIRCIDAFDGGHEGKGFIKNCAKVFAKAYMFDRLTYRMVHKKLPGAFVTGILEEDLTLDESFERYTSPKKIIAFLLEHELIL